MSTEPPISISNNSLKQVSIALSSISFVSSSQSTSSTTATDHTRNLISPINLDFHHMESRQSSHYEEEHIVNKPPKQYRFRYPVRSQSELEHKIQKVDALINKYKNYEWYNLGKEEESEDEEESVKNMKLKVTKYKKIVSAREKKQKEQGNRDPYAKWRR